MSFLGSKISIVFNNLTEEQLIDVLRSEQGSLRELEAGATSLRQALQIAVEDASVEGRFVNGDAAFVGLGVTAFKRMEEALSSTSAGKALLDRIQALEEQSKAKDAYILRILILANGCQIHPAYRAVKEPEVDCQRCRYMWEARTAVDKEAGAGGETTSL